MSVATALRKLDTILARNRVKYELRLTERHEKKGVKRRRLQSERWRKHFANEVRLVTPGDKHSSRTKLKSF